MIIYVYIKLIHFNHILLTTTRLDSSDYIIKRFITYKRNKNKIINYIK